MSDERKFRHGSYEGPGFDNWMTPPEMISALESEFGPMWDPCPPNPTQDGLALDWPTDKWVFVNPPYSKIADWTDKCFSEWKKGVSIILLIPARTDTRYFHRNVIGSAEVRFVKGRVKFVHPEGIESKSAPFPSILCIYHGEVSS